MFSSNYKWSVSYISNVLLKWSRKSCMNLFPWHSGRVKGPLNSGIILLDMCSLETNYIYFDDGDESIIMLLLDV